MADRAKKISELDAAAAPANTDYVVLVTNTAGTAVTKRLSFANVLVRSTAAAVAAITAPQGQILFGTTTGFTSNSTFFFDSYGLEVTSNATFGVEGSGSGVIHVHGAVASNLAPDTPNNYFLGNTSHPWASISVSTIRTANLTYNDTNIVIQMAANAASYLQSVLQNSSAAANASTNYNVSADTANSTVNYGEYGINSSTFSGSGRFSDPLAVYLAAATSNLAIGTYGSNPVSVVVNSNINWTYGTDGSLTLPGGPVVFTGAATTRSGVNTQVGTAGSNGSIYLSTAGKIYLKVSDTGAAATDWQRVTTTAVD
jgi:hypothetical protein